MTAENIILFKEHLLLEEKADLTVEKYVRDVKAFFKFAGKGELTKEKVLEYKKSLVEKYAPASVNSMLSSLNAFFDFCGWKDIKVKALKIQKKMFTNKKKELSKEEYDRLLMSAKTKNARLYYIMQTICATGIRVSEVKYVTVEGVKKGALKINCKGKMRVVILPETLCEMLIEYAKAAKIKKGPVFVTKTGKPLDRSNIWNDMKRLCKDAQVGREKVFPHNLRHLFARTYYSIEKDIVRLADILGHSSVNTTRIYTMETGDIHRKQMEKIAAILTYLPKGSDGKIPKNKKTT